MKIGPATLVTAAFIGPGTVTICTLTGFQYGFSLLWVLLLAVCIAIVLQEMAARIGIVTGSGMGEAIAKHFENISSKVFAFGLVISAIAIGNAAYEAGNIAGATLGAEVIFDNESLGKSTINPISLIIGILAFLLLSFGTYKALEKILISIVVLMALCFVVTAIIVSPPMQEILSGMFIPTLPENGWLPAIAIIGTTVVPYNLFLHASTVSKKWSRISDLSTARFDTAISITLGGIISLSIMIAAGASSSLVAEVSNAADLAKGLEPTFGPFAKYALSIGLLAAGLSSAITAPLAAGYAMKGLFPKIPWVFKLTWFIILLLGTVFSTIGFSPILVIRFAQIANGLLLPISATFVLWLVNRKEVMGTYQNNLVQNFLGFLVLFLTLVLSYRTFYNLIQ